LKSAFEAKISSRLFEMLMAHKFGAPCHQNVHTR